VNLRAIYTDLDGTLLGDRASLLRDDDGAFSLLGAKALEACHRAGVEVVFYSGRGRAQLFEAARLLGAESYVYEAGAGVVASGEDVRLTEVGYDDIERSGAPAMLLEHYAGRLEYHDPWHTGREVTHLLRGDVDAAEADVLLAERGHSDLRLVDNGAIRRRMAGVERPRAYHLVPRAVSKARAIAMHMQIRGLQRDEVVAVGDSREDAGAAEVVQTFWFVANAVRKDPSLRSIRGHNIRIAQEAHGAGVYEAVVTELRERAV
jgi:hydroxymethylpyrimidine pyrophosphatase-like HAD family hydrolase